MKTFSTGYSYKVFILLIAISILLLTACKSTPIHQAYEGAPKSKSEVATFVVPANFNLLAIDGVKYSQPVLRDGATVNVLPGSHQFIIEYQDFWNIDGDNHEKVTSNPLSVTFAAKAGDQYSINTTPLETVEQARAFAEKPGISVVDTASKQSVSVEIKYNLYGGGLFSALFGPSNPKSAPHLDGSAKTKAPNNDGKALEMLKYWWETADEKQQSSFRQWLKNQ